MRSIYVLFLVLFFSTHSFSQKIKSHTSVAYWKTYSVKKLAAALTKDSCSEYEKAQRIYDWITENIKYDVWRYEHFNWKETTPKQTLRRRKALCSGYSILFQALCKEVGVKAWLVEGYDKIPNYRNNAPYFFEEHAWNVFYADSTYHLVDATWGSGGIVRKARMIMLFKHPFYFYKSKFVRRYNALFFDSDTNWFAQTHLPLLPMWQLKNQVLSMERFERQIFTPDSLSKNTISFKSDIQSYDSKAKEDNWLYEGDRGHDFFQRNNRTKGYHTYKYLKHYYEKYALGDRKNKDQSRKKNASLHADTVIFYTNKFLKDNTVRHKYVLDSIANRNKTILPFSSKLYKEDFKNKKQVKGQIRGCKNQIKLQRGGIERRRNVFARMTADNIEKINPAYNKKHPDTLAKIIARMKLIYDINTRKIDSLNTCRKFWYDSVQAKMSELDVVHDSMQQLHRLYLYQIKIHTKMNRKLIPLYLIREVQDAVMLLKKGLKLQHDQYAAIQRYIYTAYFIQQIDPINRSCIQLLKQNKSILKRIAKVSTYNAAEKKLYRLENRNLYHQLAQTTKRSEVRIQILNKNIDWLKHYRKLVSAEVRRLNIDMCWEIAINKYAIKNEYSRNKFYYHTAVHVIKNAQQVKRILRYKP